MIPSNVSSNRNLKEDPLKKGVLIGLAVAVVLSLPFYGNTWNLFMHIFGAILFMGNIVVTAVWGSLAKRSGSPEVLRYATRGIVITDVIFTTPGAVLLFLNGGILGMEWFKSGAMWIFVSLGLFVVLGLVWIVALVPLQRRMMEAAHSTTGTEPVPDETYVLFKRWFRMGGIATMLTLAVLILMVVKPTF
jgi:uncharacterized membrane protein